MTYGSYWTLNKFWIIFVYLLFMMYSSQTSYSLARTAVYDLPQISEANSRWFLVTNRYYAPNFYKFQTTLSIKLMDINSFSSFSKGLLYQDMVSGQPKCVLKIPWIFMEMKIKLIIPPLTSMGVTRSKNLKNRYLPFWNFLFLRYFQLSPVDLTCYPQPKKSLNSKCILTFIQEKVIIETIWNIFHF